MLVVCDDVYNIHAVDIPTTYFTGKDDIDKVKSVAKFLGETDLTKWWGSQVADIPIAGTSINKLISIMYRMYRG